MVQRPWANILLLGDDCLQQMFLPWDRASDQSGNTLFFHLSIAKIRWIAKKNGMICSMLGTRQEQGANHGDDQVSRVWKPLCTEEEVFFCTGQDLMYLQHTYKTVDSSPWETNSSPSQKLLWDSKMTLPTILVDSIDIISHATWYMLSYSARPVPHNFVNDSVRNENQQRDQSKIQMQITINYGWRVIMVTV